jgi:hypothetical protein
MFGGFEIGTMSKKLLRYNIPLAHNVYKRFEIMSRDSIGLTPTEWKLLRKEAKIDLKVLRDGQKYSEEEFSDHVKKLAEEEFEMKELQRKAS